MKRNDVLTLVVAVATLVFGALGTFLWPKGEQAEQKKGDSGQVTLAVPLESLPRSPASFNYAKDLLYGRVHRDIPYTFYCACTFDVKTRQIDPKSCGLQGHSKRAFRVEAEHIFPSSWAKQHFLCYREPERFSECVRDNGKVLRGRQCCQRADPRFNRFHQDLFNLWPASGELNMARSNLRFGMVEGEERAWGSCDFEVSEETGRVEPPPHVRGDIARTMKYMEATYGFRLSKQQRKLFEQWDKEDPVDELERLRAKRIEEIQGMGNPFVQ